MNLADRLHCPRCKGRLSADTAAAARLASGEWTVRSATADPSPGPQSASPDGPLHCTNCAWVVPVLNGIADFVGDRDVPAGDPEGYFGASDQPDEPAFGDDQGPLDDQHYTAATEDPGATQGPGGVHDPTRELALDWAKSDDPDGSDTGDLAPGQDNASLHESASLPDLWTRMRAAAADRWPVSLGEVLELGCGSGQLTHSLALELNNEVHGLLVTDTAMAMVRGSCRRLAARGLGQNGTVAYVRLSGHEDAIRDAVADTVVSATVLPRYGDVRRLLAMAHRVLKPGGRACFVLPNRRYYQAWCQAMAVALVQLHARERTWSEPHAGVLRVLADLRLRMLHQGDSTFLSALPDKHLFDSEVLEDLARQIGFATAEVIPLDPDPAGSEATLRCCGETDQTEPFLGELAPLVVSAGAPFFSLLSRQDASASMLLWLTKGIGPSLRVFSPPPAPPVINLVRPEAALGGAAPRWSVELTAHDTADGVVLSVGGWCLINSDVQWVRLTLDGVTRDAPVWRPRPDVHEVLNTQGLYNPLNALCSGLAVELLFDGVHPRANRCPLQLRIVLVNGIVVEGPAPDSLVMHEPVIIDQ